MNKGKWLLLAVLGMMAGACKNKNTLSGEHLPQKKMQAVMVDINLAESYSINVKDSLHHGGTKNWDSLAVFYKDIFAHHKITAEEFTQSLEWYKDHPDEMDTLFNKMIPVVNDMQTTHNKKN